MDYDSKAYHREHGDLSDLEERSFLERLAGELVFGAMAAVLFAIVAFFVVMAFAI